MRFVVDTILRFWKLALQALTHYVCHLHLAPGAPQFDARVQRLWDPDREAFHGASRLRWRRRPQFARFPVGQPAGSLKLVLSARGPRLGLELNRLRHAAFLCALLMKVSANRVISLAASASGPASITAKPWAALSSLLPASQRSVAKSVKVTSDPMERG